MFKVIFENLEVIEIDSNHKGIYYFCKKKTNSTKSDLNENHILI